MERHSSNKKRLVGSIVSDKMDKTVVVSVERKVRHKRYGKVLLRVTRYKAHDERNDCRVGDIVRIVESRPLSREKRWVVERIVKRAESEEVMEVGE